MKERPITSPRPWSHAFIYHQSALLLSLSLSKQGSIWVFMNTPYYFSPHSCLFLPTPANISSFLWLTLLYSLMHVISMPRCYLISQPSSFGLEWAEQQEHRRGGIGRGRKGKEKEQGLKFVLPLASHTQVVLCVPRDQRGWVEMAAGGSSMAGCWIRNPDTCEALCQEH